MFLLKYSFPTFLICVIFVFQSCFYDNKEDLYQFVENENCTAVTATYATDILPIITNNCLRCHRDAREDGGVNLEGYEKVKPYVDDGSFYGSTNHEAGYAVMPTSGIKIPFCDIEKMRLWIEAGALNN